MMGGGQKRLISRLVCPGLGTYTGNIHSADAAAQMAAAYHEQLDWRSGGGAATGLEPEPE
jgi:hypothetical protein